MNTPDETVSAQSMFGMLSGDNPELVANPFPMFELLRSMGSVVPLPFSLPGIAERGWLISRMQESVQILKDTAHFTVDPHTIEWDTSAEAGASNYSAPSFFLSHTMISVDDPDHRRLRSLVSKAFTPRYIESLRPRIQQIADTLLDSVQDKGEIELVADYAYPLPINVISEMLGVPKAD